MKRVGISNQTRLVHQRGGSVSPSQIQADDYWERYRYCKDNGVTCKYCEGSTCKKEGTDPWSDANLWQPCTEPLKRFEQINGQTCLISNNIPFCNNGTCKICRKNNGCLYTTDAVNCTKEECTSLADSNCSCDQLQSASDQGNVTSAFQSASANAINPPGSDSTFSGTQSFSSDGGTQNLTERSCPKHKRTYKYNETECIVYDSTDNSELRRCNNLEKNALDKGKCPELYLCGEGNNAKMYYCDPDITDIDTMNPCTEWNINSYNTTVDHGSGKKCDTLYKNSLCKQSTCPDENTTVPDEDGHEPSYLSYIFGGLCLLVCCGICIAVVVWYVNKQKQRGPPLAASAATPAAPGTVAKNLEAAFEGDE